MTTVDVTPSGPFPVPDDFPLVWEDPKDADAQWMRDAMHAPEPVTPLGGALGDFVSHGFSYAFAQYSVPASFRMKPFNNWVYVSVTPLPLPPEELERMGQEAEARLGAFLPRLGEVWESEYLPELQSLIAELASIDPDTLSKDELTASWERTLEIGRRMFEIHFLIVVPSYLAVSEFDELYRSLFDAADAHESYRLVSGHMNKTVETGLELWELSRRVAPEVRRVLTESEPSDVLAALEQVDGGPAFLEELRSYLATYGERGDKWDMAYPSWIEDPAPVLKNLKEYLAQDRHPAAELEEAAAERDRLIERAREAITAPEHKGAFDLLLGAASVGIVLSEDHGFWIDFKGMYHIRAVALGIARRLVEAGVIDEPDDIFFLRPDEITETLRGFPSLDRRSLVAERRASLAAAAKVQPPPMIGTPAPEGPENPVMRSQMKFFGGPPVMQEGPADEIRGHPGAPGVVRGRARIVSSIADADRLEAGDVLVAETTAPPWTPLFAFASAVVTDTGGIMSHCAVVAREYQIPAVVGCGGATATIRDGQTVEVDGTNGIVRLIG